MFMSRGVRTFLKKGAITGMTQATAANAAIQAATNSWLENQFMWRSYHHCVPKIINPNLSRLGDFHG